MYIAQIIALFTSITLSRSEKFDIYGRLKCCSDSLSPLSRQQQFWQDTLREATYQSIIRHLDFSGTLDGRLDRDQKLWRHLREARYIVDENPTLENLAEETRTGVLLVNPQSTNLGFEFHQTDIATFKCSEIQCHSTNNSLLGFWQVRRTENPYTLWIRVKLPTIGRSPIEDVYEYNIKYGLKKLNPDPFEYKSFKAEKNHRFLIQPKKNDFKSTDRMDFRFPGASKVFGTGRIMPTSILYNSPIKSIKSENGWNILPQRKPHPGVIVETGQRNPTNGPPFGDLSGPFVASGPRGFQHIIHSLPSISPPQNLNHPTEDFRGFLPSIGPINAPPPYKTEYAYDPRYFLYYKQPNTVLHHTTMPTKQFKPSTEFVKYSELDPFYHPEGESGLLQTSPMPEFHYENFHNTRLNSPNSINEQLPTNSPIENTNPSFQIIVGNFNPIIDTTTEISTLVTTGPPLMSAIIVPSLPSTRTQTKPATDDKLKPLNRIINPPPTTKAPRITTSEIPSTTEIPQTLQFQTTLTNIPEQTEMTMTMQTEKNDNAAIQAFGEKIKPKASTAKPNEAKQSTTEFQKEVFGLKKLKGDRKPSTEIQENSNYSLKDDNTRSNVKDMEEIETAGLFTEFTTENEQVKSTFMGFEITTENNRDEEEVTNQYSPNTATNIKETLPTINSTEITISEVGMTETEMNTNTSDAETVQPQMDPALSDYISEEITELNNETTTDKSQTSDDSDFFSSLTDSFFAIETTTENIFGRKNKISKEKPLPQNIDTETQESKQQNVQYRLLTFPGDSVSIVANRISKTVSYKTGTGKEGKVQAKPLVLNRYRFSDNYKDYSTIL